MSDPIKEVGASGTRSSSGVQPQVSTTSHSHHGHGAQPPSNAINTTDGFKPSDDLAEEAVGATTAAAANSSWAPGIQAGQTYTASGATGTPGIAGGPTLYSSRHT